MKPAFSFLILFVLGFNCFAQQFPNFRLEKVEFCGNFKTPIIVPPKDFDAKILIEIPSQSDTKTIAVNPCINNEAGKNEAFKFDFFGFSTISTIKENE